MIKEAIEKVVSKQDLTYDEAYTVMNEIMNGETSQVQNAAYLAALSTKSAKAETIDEISGSAAAMRDHALQVEHDMDVLEIVKSGAADCLEALGINISLSPEKCVELLKEINICFLFAQKYHASMKYVGAVRKELGIRTVFNILGPLTNPAHPTTMLLGVYDEYLLDPLAQVLMSLGVKRGMVIYGQDCLDEISLSAPTSVCEFQDGWFKRYVIQPEDFGFTRCKKDDIKGGTPEENAAITRAILAGQEQGPKRDIVLLNAGAAIYLGGKAASIADGIGVARSLIENGAGFKKIAAFAKLSQ